ncbi:MAG: hypothetical protein NTY39_07545 [Campylobacterales bacterium]|nr:hypothetical protein [Campylobacterales bacterium]
MNLNKLPTWQKGLLLIITAGAVLLLGFFQIYTSATATKVEGALFNVLQFIFSIIFAWFLSAFIGESQFVESQRKFAIGAFRRIKEIERSINRTQKYVSLLEDEADNIVKAKLIAVNGGLSAMQDTVRSSIADWSDIIGDEIQITHETNKLKKIRNDNDEVNQHIDGSTTENITDKINALIQSLPKEIANDFESYEDTMIEECVEDIANQWLEERQLDLYCFWDSNGMFSSDVSSVKAGDRLSLSRGMTESRMGALMLFNDDNQQVAVVTNVCTNEATYEDFVEAFEAFYGRKLIPKVLNGKPLTVKVIKIEEFDHQSERQHLTVQVEQEPVHPCVFELIDDE